MRKIKELIASDPGVIVWVIFALCAAAAFVGLATGHKEIIGIAFGTLGAILASYVAITVADDYRMKARIRKASKRTPADMF